MTGKAKSKGNSAERELAKFLMATFGGSFIRVPNSGAYVGGKNAFRREFLSDGQVRNAKGDIIPPGHMPRLVLESKFYADFAFHSLLTPGNVPQLDTWIKQTVECVDPGDLWFVAFKINRKGWFTCMSYDVAMQNNFKLENHCVYSDGKNKYIVTELNQFFINNKDLILQLSA